MKNEKIERWLVDDTSEGQDATTAQLPALLELAEASTANGSDNLTLTDTNNMDIVATRDNPTMAVIIDYGEGGRFGVIGQGPDGIQHARTFANSEISATASKANARPKTSRRIRRLAVTAIAAGAVTVGIGAIAADKTPDYVKAGIAMWVDDGDRLWNE